MNQTTKEVLKMISKEQPVFQKDIVKYLGQTDSNVSQLLDKLENQNLVARGAVGRKMVAALTTRGQRIVSYVV